MYRPRLLSLTLARAARTFPALLVTGPRQAGKTTLLRHDFGATHRYVSLDDPSLRERVRSDPVGFLADHPAPVILDEVQHVPELLSYVKAAIDESPRPGSFLLSGSQPLPLVAGASESLAGRVAMLTLLPYSVAEARDVATKPAALDPTLDRFVAARNAPGGRRIPLATWLLRGGYPPMWAPRVDRHVWGASYVQSYLERDVRAVLNVSDLDTFQVFLRLVAARTGQILNLAEVGRDAGVSAVTARKWLSVLQATHQVVLLRPHHANLGKRSIKSPKVYWMDTGIACLLMGLREEEAVMHGPSAGALFETAVVVEIIKAHLHRGVPPALWFFRSRDGLEVDLLLERGPTLHPIEIKLTSTPRPVQVAALQRWRAASKSQAPGLLVANVREPTALAPGVRVTPWDAL